MRDSRPKVLVANRGEIACRVIRACRELGLPTVAVFSDADAHARHTWLADEAVRLGPPPSNESYLLGDRILAAAKSTGATLIHPGYGFLSENAEFRDACDDAGVTFVGPPASAMRAMGSKTAARDAMRKAGVPVVPGSDGPLTSLDDVHKVADSIGFPVMLKAAAGGGGKGIRIVHGQDEIQAAWEGAQREAAAYFKDATVYLEKAIARPRHVEIQVLADRHGHTVHLFERECSVQRRNQKIIEESPAAVLKPETRAAMGAMAVRASAAVHYEGAGTIECLVDADERFWFLEMNTRLQVEHPVTELATGIDLVVTQLRVAMGQPLPFAQDDLYQRGHAIECRIYAEDPARGFLPSPGTLRVYRPPIGPGLRLDDGVVEGDEVPRYYDPMIAKLSAWAPDRPQCIARMQAALQQFEIAGVAHNIKHLQHVLASAAFQSGRYDTGIVGSLPPLPELPEPDAWTLALAAVADHRARRPADTTAATADSAWSRHARSAGLRPK